MSILSKSVATLLAPRNLVRLSKRWSGHNILEPHPSNFEWMKWKDMLHLYFMVGVIPLGLFTTIVNIKANPELAEIPEGYEPRHWEYFKNPITRWMARYVMTPQDTEHEIMMAQLDIETEKVILQKLTDEIDKVMAFYQDYRSYHFNRLTFPEDIRRSRQAMQRHFFFWHGMGDDVIDETITEVVPVEGMSDGARDAEKFK